MPLALRPLALLAALALPVAGAAAQIDRDVVEVGGSGSVLLSPDFNVVLAPLAGYFVAPTLQVGLNPVVATDFEDFNAFLSAFGAYYPTGGTARTTYPFVGASLGVNLTDGGGGLLIGGRAGVQRFLTESAALTLSVNAQTTDDFDVDRALLSLNAGFSLFLDRRRAVEVVDVD